MRSACFAAMVATAVSTKGGQVVTYFVKQQGAEQLLKQALEVSDPDSERYGDFMSFEDVVALQRPSPEHLKQLHAHLDSLGVQDRKSTIAGDKVVAVLPGEVDVVPPSLLGALDGVTTSTDWKVTRTAPRVSRRARRGGRRYRRETLENSDEVLPNCLAESMITATCLRGIYGVNTTSSHPKNLQAVIVNEEFSQSDLKHFEAENKLPAQPIVKLIDGKAGAAQTEASLDTQYIIAFGPGTPTWYMYINGAAENPFASWLTYMSNASTIPWVHSLSVGAPENEVGNALVARMNTEMAALGARGATIVFASGDSGYQANQKFGAGSPYVTAVGGVWNGELGMQNYYSVDPQTTGGFSSLETNAKPSYQDAAVAAYLKTSGQRPSSFDSSRRGVPDLSLFDADIEIVEGGQNSVCGGTSAAAPILSGMLSLVNDALLTKGSTPLGFVNPLLYKHADIFSDITKGNNNGFAAVKGWDPASGLGTFSKTTLQQLTAVALAAKQSAAHKRSALSHQVVV